MNGYKSQKSKVNGFWKENPDPWLENQELGRYAKIASMPAELGDFLAHGAPVCLRPAEVLVPSTPPCVLWSLGKLDEYSCGLAIISRLMKFYGVSLKTRATGWMTQDNVYLTQTILELRGQGSLPSSAGIEGFLSALPNS